MKPVTYHIVAAFSHARACHSELHKTWIDISVRIGFLLPDSLLWPSLQRAGDLDMLLGAMEDDFCTALVEAKSEDHGFHYQMMLSELWIGHIYEIVRLLKERNLADGDDFNAIAHDLRLLRIPLEKHEIVEDRRLTSPLLMMKFPAENNEELQTIVYDKSDLKRAHIMLTSVSDRGSAMWYVLDHRAHKEFWLERRALSDRLLALWRLPPTK